MLFSLVLLEHTGLQKMLKVCESYTKEYSIKFNSKNHMFPIFKLEKNIDAVLFFRPGLYTFLSSKYKTFT